MQECLHSLDPSHFSHSYKSMVSQINMPTPTFSTAKKNATNRKGFWQNSGYWMSTGAERHLQPQWGCSRLESECSDRKPNKCHESIESNYSTKLVREHITPQWLRQSRSEVVLPNTCLTEGTLSNSAKPCRVDEMWRGEKRNLPNSSRAQINH